MELMRFHPKEENGSALVPYRFLEEMDQLFDEFISPRRARDAESGKWVWSFAVDVEEDKDAFTLRAELPGLRKEDVKITSEDGVLTIAGEKRREKVSDDQRMHRVERSYGSFRRSFSLPRGAKTEDIQASYKDGVLTVTVPKQKEAQAKEVKIQVD